MSTAAAPIPASPQLDPASRALLEGLGALHAVVVAVDATGRTVFAQDPEGRLGEEPPPTFADVDGAPALVRAIADCLADETASADAPGLRSFDVASDPPLRVVLVDAAVPEAPLETLARKNEELETCLRSVSHDLRSPLVSVLGFTRLLRDDFGAPLGRTGLHFVDRIEQAGRNMQRLLQDMLELARIGDTPIRAVHVSPLKVLEVLVAELKLPLEEKQIELVLPNEAPVVIGDRTRLYQLFSNLIGNAIRHADPDRPGRIEVTVEEADGGWQIAVADDGPGIARADQQRIFEAFQTAAPPSRGGKSSGLGLAIVRKIVEAHHGRIHVESEPGQGARFVVWLPRPEEHSGPPDTP